MTRQELRVFLNDWFCGCGAPDDAARRLMDILALHPLYDHRPEIEALFQGDTGLEMLTLYTLAYFGLTEHGGTVGGGWLTDKGKTVLEALQRESANDFDTLCEASCLHGYGVETELLDCPECGPMNRR